MWLQETISWKLKTEKNRKSIMLRNTLLMVLPAIMIFASKNITPNLVWLQRNFTSKPNILLKEQWLLVIFPTMSHRSDRPCEYFAWIWAAGVRISHSRSHLGTCVQLLNLWLLSLLTCLKTNTALYELR